MDNKRIVPDDIPIDGVRANGLADAKSLQEQLQKDYPLHSWIISINKTGGVMVTPNKQF